MKINVSSTGKAWQGALPALVLLLIGSARLSAQYDKVAALGSDSAITAIGGPASQPLVETAPYNMRDLRPTGYLNDHLPKWIQFGLEERLRAEGYQGNGFKPGANASYLLNRYRLGVIIQPTSWLKVVGQMQ